jgi:hypothetical protein
MQLRLSTFTEGKRSVQSEKAMAMRWSLHEGTGSRGAIGLSEPFHSSESAPIPTLSPKCPKASETAFRRSLSLKRRCEMPRIRKGVPVIAQATASGGTKSGHSRRDTSIRCPEGLPSGMTSAPSSLTSVRTPSTSNREAIRESPCNDSPGLPSPGISTLSPLSRAYRYMNEAEFHKRRVRTFVFARIDRNFPTCLVV